MKIIFFLLSCLLLSCGSGHGDDGKPDQPPAPVPTHEPTVNNTVETCVLSQINVESTTIQQNIALGVKIKKSCNASESDMQTILAEKE